MTSSRIVVFDLDGTLVDTAPDLWRDVLSLLDQALALVMRAHRDIPRYLRGPAILFWVFHVVRDYAATLREGQSPHLSLLPGLLAEAEDLERAVGPVDTDDGVAVGLEVRAQVTSDEPGRAGDEDPHGTS